MPVVSTVDYINKLIYLHADTVGVDLDTIDVYREVRALRRTTESHRRFDFMITAGGNVEKITGTSYTAPYVQLLHGCRIVPYDTDHKLKVIRDTFTDDGVEGRDCFDRTGLSNHVDIDYSVDKVEVRVVTTGGSALTPTESAKLLGLPEEAEIAEEVWSYERP